MSLLDFIDDDLIRYCEDNGFPVREMTVADFKSVENTLSYSVYKLKTVMDNSFKDINIFQEVQSGKVRI